ncbi:TNF receptor-associated factor 4b [Ictalurus punctatus]|uniref:TNF receptor-associated factor n=1 Tax=Ictalurus punctatus TaxID=7998 RepID=A0A2D0T1E5_ICTPU|nr:TNF receptor-associated factor 4b [Ictalurus punctatus]
MPGLDYKFLERPRRRLLCPLCNKPMREPVQVSTCGHRFCDTCLQEFLSAGVFKCPEDQLPLDYAKIFPDVELEQQILALPIRCIHSEEGCRWSAQNKHLQTHLTVCAYNVVPCPNRCMVKLLRRDLPQHLQYDCTKRKLRCDHCAEEFTGEAHERHQDMCPEESVYCENKCGARMVRRLLTQHSLSECPKRKLPCKYCTKEFLYDTIQHHQIQCPRVPVQCPNSCGTHGIAREDLMTHVKESCETALVLCPFKDAGCKYRCSKPAVPLHLDEATHSHLSLLCGLVNRQRLELRELRRRVEELSGNQDGSLLWKIPNYSRHLQETRNGSNGTSELFSPAFYSHRYGYRLQVSIFPNGNGSGEGTHLSVYIRVLPGEYDGLLEWPFPHRVTFSLLDQSDPALSKPQHVTESFSPDPNWKNFQRPRPGAIGSVRTGCLDESMLGFGYPKFISHEQMKERNYIRDNAIFIKAFIDVVQRIIN